MALPLSIKASAQFPIIVDLSTDIAAGIGKVISAHALIEHAVQHLLYHLMVAHAHVGRIAIAKRDPAVHFQSVQSLMSAWGIDMNTNVLEKEIRDHTKQRNYLAHGVWVARPDGVLALSRVAGYYDTDDGKRDAAVLPEPFIPPPGYFIDLQEAMIATAQKVFDLKESIAPPKLPPLPDISAWT